jgi:lipopolysaccharide transport system permease protein
MSDSTPVAAPPGPHEADKNLETLRQSERPVRVIEPGRAGLRNVGTDVWHARELLYFLTWRDVKVRYKQTALGVLWALIQPVLSMVVLSLIFGRIAGITNNTGGVPYPIFVYSGLLPWIFFANTLSTSANSVVGNAVLVTKVRFPRITLPMAAVAAGLVDLLLAFSVLAGLMAWYHVPLSPRLLAAPLLVLGITMLTLGFGAIFAALTVSFRDFRYVIPFMTQIWMFLTPVMYPSGVVPSKWRWLLAVNPVTGWISGFRSVFLGTAIDRTSLAVAVSATVVVFFAGIHYFRATERRFADVI